MMAASEEDLLCDLAETYGIWDYRALPVKTAAALARGLREDSRIKMRLLGSRVSSRELLLAAAVDRLSILIWQNTRDGAEGVNRPPSVLSVLLGQEEAAGKARGFDTAEEFEAAWEQITGVCHGR